ncbi:MAG: ribonuclease HII [Spirochaetes bacterium]|nr:ribonuclease HII [Spirochaetota bacterium]
MLENRAHADGFRAVGGIDEAGRGALAGPVVACCVVLDPKHIPSGILDSKKLTDKKRRILSKQIREKARSVGVGICGPGLIEEYNIYNATVIAMKRSVFSCDIKPDFLLIDAVQLYDISISSESMYKGEDKSVSIAAASIVAKVYRDDLMILLARDYPQYGFEMHKGYGTTVHRAALLRYGPTIEHRYTYRPVREAAKRWK